MIPLSSNIVFSRKLIIIMMGQKELFYNFPGSETFEVSSVSLAGLKIFFGTQFICQVEFQKESRLEKMIVTMIIFLFASYPIGVILRYLFQSDRSELLSL